MARPSEFSDKTAAVILERIASGESLRAICEAEEMPARSTVFQWLSKRDEFADQYARAREEQADAIFDEILSIADDGRNDWMERNYGENVGWIENGEALRRSALRIDARKWMAGKLRPKKYGERSQMELTGKDGGALVVKIVRFGDAGNHTSE